ncbi:MAG: hypothetical protein DI539_21720 [Flavobacterium psychrophilum]|nr:MAG: hypothetical protein DI539_21720 [Flavobacterium psychrophilum]
MPVTKEERDFKEKYGTEALEEKFDEGLNYIDPLRKSLV